MEAVQYHSPGTLRSGPGQQQSFYSPSDLAKRHLKSCTAAVLIVHIKVKYACELCIPNQNRDHFANIHIYVTSLF